ncbi:TetR/AcrR family transcriptional regulator [Nocardioides sp. InS609-2]|uniref:TetR/AcrR family transcriptional regulator n=1 Tax=Nocardioides sp. InS609-2 TaxID=2760705 RepID=UPI0020BEF51B|nr:TetR/AcrR family transcriptional regulator [Nocardioides sp. InS609-2]
MPARRETLTRAAIVDAAFDLADASGVAALSMRRVGQAVGVEAMSLYHHVANKDDLLDAIVDRIFADFGTASPEVDWRTSMHDRAHAARRVLRAHPWAVGLVDSRPNAGPATLAHHDSVIGALRAGGFSIADTGHAFALLDSFIYGFSSQSANLPFDDHRSAEAVAEGLIHPLPTDVFPHLVEFATQHVLKPGWDFEDEFEFGLELILGGLERLLSAKRRP